MVQSDTFKQKLHKELQLVRSIKQGLVVANVAHRQPKNVINQVGILLANIAAGEELSRVLYYEVESLDEHVGVLGLVTKLCKAELKCVDKCAQRILLVALHSFPQEWM